MTMDDRIGSYIVMGHVNLHKSNVCGGDFCRYLHDLCLKHQLSADGDVIGMDKYGIIAKQFRAPEQRLKRLQEAARLEPVNAHTFVRTDSGQRLERSHSETVPRNVNVSIGSSLWNMDLAEALQPEPLGANASYAGMMVNDPEYLSVDGVKYNLSSMNSADREVIMDAWQKESLPGCLYDLRPSSFLFALQEPYWFNNRMGDLAKTGHTLLFDRSAKKVRAAIIGSSNLNLWMVPEYSNGDVVVAEWDSGIEEIGKVFIVSWYADANLPITQTLDPLLVRLLKRCRREGRQCLLMGDLNAWSSLWNCPEDSPRGLVMEAELVYEYNMSVLNKGNQSTYFHHNGTTETIIDVSLCTSAIEKYIRNWRVRDAVVTSDHASIEFTFHWRSQVKEKIYPFNFRKFKEWRSWARSLDEKKFDDSDPIWTASRLNTEVLSFYKDIRDTLSLAGCERKVEREGVRGPARGANWYTQECTDLYKHAIVVKCYLRKRRQFPQNYHEEPIYSRQDLTDAWRDYWKAVRRARKKGWQNFSGTIEGSADMGRFNKIIKGGKTEEISLFIKDDGTSMSPEETIGTLCSEHFPGCKRNEEVQQLFQARERKVADADNKINIHDAEGACMSLEKLQASVRSFSNHKGAGPDNIAPIVYKQMGPVAMHRLLMIIKASFLLGIFPNEWLKIRVIFIPKPGKKSYLEPRSWRPISLMQNMMKVMEKMVVWDAQSMQNRELHYNQHGFRRGRSCESALTSLVGRIEKGLVEHKWSIAVFLDIKGAFDNITNESMESMMRNRGCREATIKWYKDFFLHRSISIDSKGVELDRYPIIGSPQGGIGSPWLWNLIIDELHEEMEGITGVDSEGFADDTTVISVARPQDTLQSTANRVQVGLDAAVRWANRHGLQFSPEKTKVILFTRKKKIGKPPDLWLGQSKLSYCTEPHRHLGVFLDAKLDFAFHLKEKIKAAKGVLIRLMNSMGKVWGLKPLMALWMYRAVARPMLCYGSLVWSKVVEFSWAKGKLAAFQSMALRTLGCFRKSTPLAGLEVMTFTFPLKLFIQAEAARAYIRTRGFEKFTENEMYSIQPLIKGHRQRIREWLYSMGCDYTDTPLDDVPRRYIWDKKFQVDWLSMDPTNKNYGKPLNDTCCNLYTDGSKLEEGKAGAGFCVSKIVARPRRRVEIVLGSVHTDKSYFLGDATVFQCEVYALKQAAHWVFSNARQMGFTGVVLNSDSQAALKALALTEVKSELICETVAALNRAAEVLDGRLILRWNKGHCEDNRGNCRADDLARQGAGRENDEDLPDDEPKLALASVKSALALRMKLEWQHCWSFNIDMKWPCNRTKNWFSQLNAKKSWNIVNNSREMVSKLVQYISGHGYMNAHEYKCNPDHGPGPWCDRCNEDGKYQTPEHLLEDCEQLGHLRLLVFGEVYPEASALSIAQLSRFLNGANIRWLPVDED